MVRKAWAALVGRVERLRFKVILTLFTPPLLRNLVYIQLRPIALDVSSTANDSKRLIQIDSVELLGVIEVSNGINIFEKKSLLTNRKTMPVTSRLRSATKRR
jgi:hypothetical protein